MRAVFAIAPFLFVIVIPAVLISAMLTWFRRQSAAKNAQAQQMAAQYGFRLETASKKPPPLDFDLFGRGSSRGVSYQFWRDTDRDSVFQYEYTTGSGKNRSTHHQTCALVSLPFRAPGTTIGAENFFGGIGRVFGIRDIEVESVEFNAEYRVSSDDERFAVAMLDQPMIAWMLSGESGRGSIRFELWGPWLLCISRPLDMVQMPGFLDWSQGIRRQFPAVLSSLYPLQ